MADLVHPRLMASLANFFPHRATVQRPAPTGHDAYGAEAGGPVAHLNGLACRYVLDAQANPLSALAEDPLILSARLIVASAADIRQGDQVVDITLEADGSLVDAGPWRVLAALPRSPGGSTLFLTLSLERAR